MTIVRHGISIGIERIGEEFFMTLSVTGKLTHEDYELIAPMIDSAIEGIAQPKIKMFVDVTRLDGWELRAAWDDLKLGIKHGKQFERVAMLGNKSWHEWAVKVGGWFVDAEVKYFEEETKALAWLQS